MTQPQVLVLHAPGTNRDREAALACEMAGAHAEIVHIASLLAQPQELDEFQMLVLPGGFSYGDDLGGGKIWSLDLRYRLTDALARFHAARRPILGICNGFQVLIKSGLLPGGWHRDASPTIPTIADASLCVGQTATLTRNASARFECRWVYLRPDPASPCVFTRGLHELIHCPVAHGEGRFALNQPDDLARLQAARQVALTYTDADGRDIAGAYPLNPNGSQGDVAGVCDPTGTVFGLMPHPEDHVLAAQHPRAARGQRGMLGLPMFINGVRYAAEL